MFKTYSWLSASGASVMSSPWALALTTPVGSSILLEVWQLQQLFTGQAERGVHHQAWLHTQRHADGPRAWSAQSTESPFCLYFRAWLGFGSRQNKEFIGQCSFTNLKTTPNIFSKMIPLIWFLKTKFKQKDVLTATFYSFSGGQNGMQL